MGPAVYFWIFWILVITWVTLLGLNLFGIFFFKTPYMIPFAAAGWSLMFVALVAIRGGFN